MAGDHKCPVCQSTFTRPQHVARHMRSHTGDRPYKCQHCGDQFARSDLLSRHINKCHASEKPPTTTAPSRRKGTAAASRATTSKQACDQCVTSSLPCDGANPCSKCVQRKCRCTFVKFHRQTAPAGPGHPLPPTMPPAGARNSMSLGAPRLPDDFLLAPPPGTMNLASMYAPPHQYSLAHPAAPPVYSHDYPSLPPLASALAPSESPMPPMLQAHHRDALDNTDTMARIRAQAELLTRAGVMHNGGLTLAQPAPSADSAAALPGLYAAAAAHEGHFDRYNLPPPVQWDTQRSYPHSKDFEAPYGPRSQSHTTVTPFSAAGAAGGEPSLQTHPPSAVSTSYEVGPGHEAAYHASSHPSAASVYAQHPSHHHQHTRSDDLSSSEGDFSSDAGSTSTGPSHSVPSSASSSTIHLPLPSFNALRSQADMGGKDPYDQRYQSGPHNRSQSSHEGEGGFSSAFGLMSLDDPNVIAGLASDGQPFFSGLGSFSPGNGSSTGPGGLSLATPTQDLIAQLKSAGGREGMDSKEMRDFWKMYLKTPLTGPNSGIMFPLQTPTGPGVQLGQGYGATNGRPSPTRRHSRVASLPSMKTPPLFAEERLGGSYARPSTGDHYDSHATGSQNHQQPAGAYNSTVRTTLHGANDEDLKSYEQAVLSRRAPMQLNLVPRRKGSLAIGGNPPPNPPMGKSKSMSPVVPHAGFSAAVGLPSSLPANSGGGSKIAELLNRPGSSSSAGTTGSSSGSGMSVPSSASTANTTASQVSSSLAHVFGGDERQGSPPEGYAQTYRPSFKRIASQTLGPDNRKRALLGPAGWDHDHDEAEEEEGEGAGEEEEEEEEVGAEEKTRMTLGSREGAIARSVSLSAAQS